VDRLCPLAIPFVDTFTAHTRTNSCCWTRLASDRWTVCDTLSSWYKAPYFL